MSVQFPEHMARFYAAEMTLALGCLHERGIIYRDLKPENILLDSEGHVKLADFGLAKEGVVDASSGANSLCGTPEYLSPEVLDRQGHGTAVDWWNLGMVTYEMLTGLPPWYTTDRQKLFERLRRATLKFPFYVSRPAASIIQGMLTRDPSTSLLFPRNIKPLLTICAVLCCAVCVLTWIALDERLGANGVEEIKAHPFFAAVDWVALYERRITPPFNPCRQQDVVVRPHCMHSLWSYHLLTSTTLWCMYMCVCVCPFAGGWEFRTRIYWHASKFCGRICFAATRTDNI